MAEHENSIGESDEWYTPRDIFEALGLTFDLDPCSPGLHHWVPCHRIYTKEDDGLIQRWEGLVFMNPPYGGRNGHVPWLDKFLIHSNGIGIVRSYTINSSALQVVPQRGSFLGFPLALRWHHTRGALYGCNFAHLFMSFGFHPPGFIYK